jgi:hypothetical protein
MKALRIAFLTLILAGALAGAGHAATSVAVQVSSSGRATVDVGFFYDDLASYGSWVERPQYGWVWRPRAVASTWRPYQQGHWAWTDYGWTWISEEPYGWATYHYGRWYDDPDYGWEWVPGDEWAPAWVSWQEGDEYIGWAPLPPSYTFRPGRYAASLAPEAYVFVPERRFLAPRIVDYAVPRTRVVTVFRQTRNITDYRVVDRRIVNQGVSVERIQRVLGRAVPRYQVSELSAGERHRGARFAKNRVEVFRPQIRKVKVAPPSARPGSRRAVVVNAPHSPHRAEPRQQQQVQPQGRGRQRQEARQHGGGHGKPDAHHQQGKGKGGKNKKGHGGGHN